MSGAGAAEDPKPYSFIDEEQCYNCNRRVKNNVVLLTSKCGHDLCKSCIKTKLHMMGSAKCGFAGCAELVNEEDFKPKTFHRGEVHREMYVRQTKLACYNSSINDFRGNKQQTPLEQYNDYLAIVEDLAFDLTYNWNDPEVIKKCEATIKKYKEKNAKLIKINNTRIDHERLEKKRKLKEERLSRKREKKKLDAARNAQTGGNYKRQLAVLKQELLDQKRPVTEVMAEMKRVMAARDADHKASEDALRQAVRTGPSKQKVSTEQAESDRVAAEALEAKRERARERARAPNPPYKYRRALAFGQNVGPAVPATPLFVTSGYAPFVATKHVPLKTVQLMMGAMDEPADARDLVAKIKAGGHAPEITARKAIQEAFSCLFLDDLE